MPGAVTHGCTRSRRTPTTLEKGAVLTVRASQVRGGGAGVAHRAKAPAGRWGAGPPPTAAAPGPPLLPSSGPRPLLHRGRLRDVPRGHTHLQEEPKGAGQVQTQRRKQPREPGWPGPPEWPAHPALHGSRQASLSQQPGATEDKGPLPVRRSRSAGYGVGTLWSLLHTHRADGG